MRTRAGAGWFRSLIADYGVPLMVLVWAAMSYAVPGSIPSGVPRRLYSPLPWDTKSLQHWTVAKVYWIFTYSTIWNAQTETFILSIFIHLHILNIDIYFRICFQFPRCTSLQLYFLLWWSQASISSTTALRRRWLSRKNSTSRSLRPSITTFLSSASWYVSYPISPSLIFLVGGAWYRKFQVLICGLLGIPPSNGVLPQSPMHTKSLSVLKRQVSESFFRTILLCLPVDFALHCVGKK